MKPLILIVDDTPQNVQLIGQNIKPLGYNLAIATDGVEAIKKAKELRPTIILMDINMPNMSGIEACKKLKLDSATSEIPIIFITAKNDASTIKEAFEAGGVDYIVKPFNRHELISRVQTHINLYLRDVLYKEEAMKSRTLLHILSHDLMNPVGAAYSYIDYMTNEEGKEELRPCLRSLNKAINLMDFIRTYMAIDQGKIEIHLESYKITSLINESLEVLEQKIKDKEIKINMKIEEGIEVKVEKTSFINSVLTNIFTNAIKFSDKGSSIDINARKIEDEIILEVRDYGIGMPKSLLDRVFNFSGNTSRKGTSGEEGTGFGMPLIKKFVDEYDGELLIESTEKSESDDHGTKIIIKLTA